MPYAFSDPIFAILRIFVEAVNEPNKRLDRVILRRSRRISFFFIVYLALIFSSATGFASETGFDRFRSELWQAQGAAYLAKGEYARALKKFTDAYRIDPNIDTLNAAIQCALHLKLYDRAETLLEVLLRQNPNYPLGSYYLGFLKLRKGEGEHAIRYLSRSAEREEFPAYAFLGLSSAYERVGDHSAASESLMQARLLDSQLQEKWDHLSAEAKQPSKGTVTSAPGNGIPRGTEVTVPFENQEGVSPTRVTGKAEPRETDFEARAGFSQGIRSSADIGEVHPLSWFKRNVYIPQGEAAGDLSFAFSPTETGSIQGAYHLGYRFVEKPELVSLNLLQNSGEVSLVTQQKRWRGILTLGAEEWLLGMSPRHLSFRLTAEPRLELKSGENSLLLGAMTGVQELNLTDLKEPLLFLPNEEALLWMRGAMLGLKIEESGTPMEWQVYYRAATRPQSALSQHTVGLRGEWEKRLAPFPLRADLEMGGELISSDTRKSLATLGRAAGQLKYALTHEWEATLGLTLKYLPQANPDSLQWSSSAGLSYRLF